jgi:hypothetical protein
MTSITKRKDGVVSKSIWAFLGSGVDRCRQHPFRVIRDAGACDRRPQPSAQIPHGGNPERTRSWPIPAIRRAGTLVGQFLGRPPPGYAETRSSRNLRERSASGYRRETEQSYQHLAPMSVVGRP